MIIIFQSYCLGDMEMYSSRSFAILSMLCNESETPVKFIPPTSLSLAPLTVMSPLPSPDSVTNLLLSAPANSIAFDSADNLGVQLSSSIQITSLSVMLSTPSHGVTNRIPFCTTFLFSFFPVPDIKGDFITGLL